MKALQRILLLAVCCTLAGCASNHVRHTEHREHVRVKSAFHNVRLLRITANVDGSGRMLFSPERVSYEHFNWQLPSDVTINGRPWPNLNESPADWPEFSRGLDLRQARVVSREGRDVIALEITPDGFAVYLCDSPNGAGPYEMTIAIPRLE